MKILYVTTIGSTMNFFVDFIGKLVKDGHTVDIATNEMISRVPEFYRELGCKIYNISCTRSPLNKATFKAIGEIKKIVNENNYDLVHCHTPIAAMCTRLACRNSRKKGTKVFYTAHGFHFYKGAPIKNWLIYYPIEKICSYFTDVLITINKEDYALAQRKMKAKKVEYVPGVGIDTKRFLDFQLSDEQKLEIRKEIGVPENAKLLLSVGELNENKNHKVVLEALSLLKDKNIHYAVAGTGNKEEYLKNLAIELGVEERFHLLGYRNDLEKIYKAADCFVHPSFREGLPVSVMEAMCSDLPCVVSKIRGNLDLVEDGVNGFLCNPRSENDFVLALHKILDNPVESIKENNTKKIQEFDISNVNKKMQVIFKTFGGKNGNL